MNPEGVAWKTRGYLSLPGNLPLFSDNHFTHSGLLILRLFIIYNHGSPSGLK
ncbi:MAG: hypothetical protein JETT_1700 [Candidatus Jettenia ecosi]|uniref:Uncharacterized protein n=1 Tax=Candidatus Jettenia ecosi TaxID=2494326 RepID=A0A533QBG3_9BACT|nr:MAG: hypothetical protein JETT_1700 [Candidatus Jettenia ecosi]